MVVVVMLPDIVLVPPTSWVSGFSDVDFMDAVALTAPVLVVMPDMVPVPIVLPSKSDTVKVGTWTASPVALPDPLRVITDC